MHKTPYSFYRLLTRVIPCFLVVTTILLAISCNRDSEQKTLSKAERDSLRLRDSLALKIGVLPTEDCLPIILAEKLKLYDAQGVSVRLRMYHAMSECHIALTHKLVEGAVIDTLLYQQINASQAKDNAQPYLYEAMRTPLKWQFLTAKKARINRLDQLGDKMIAADSHGMTHRLAEQVLDTLRKKKQMAFIIQVEDLRIRTQMLQTGNVDAALLPEPYALSARKDGARVINTVKSGEAGMLAMRTAGMNDANRKKQLQQFIKAVNIAKDSIRRYGMANYIGLLNE